MSHTDCNNHADSVTFSFCTIWKIAGPLLEKVVSSLSNAKLKAAIETVITLADAYCAGDKSDSDSDSARLSRYGIKVVGAEAAYLASLSDRELEILGRVQHELKAKDLLPTEGVGSGFF
jgi:hypothetical protein